MPKTAASLIRVSTKVQKDDGFGVEGQQKDIRLYAAKNGFSIPKTFELIEDISGDVPIEYRPIQSKVLDLIRNGKIQAVIFHRVDRIGRKNWIILQAAETIIDSGIELHVTDVGHVTDKNDIRLNIEGWKAQADKKATLEKLAKGKRDKLEAGIFLGIGATPIGYQKVGTKKQTRLVVDEKGAETVRLIFELYNAGTSVVDIAKTLTKRGYASQKGNTDWSVNMLFPILRNETYIGNFYYNKFKYVSKKRTPLPKDQWIKISVPAIIDNEVWEEVQEKLSKGKGSNKRKREYLMARRLSCQCGYSTQGIRHTTKKRKGHGAYETYYYVCSTRRSQKLLRAENCHTPRVRVELLDRKVIEFLDELIHSGKFISDLRQEQKSLEKKNKPLFAQIERADKQLVQKKKELERAMKLYLTTDEPDDEDGNDYALAAYKETEAKIRATIKELEEEKERLIREIEENSISDEDIDSFEKELQAITPKFDTFPFELTNEERQAAIDDYGRSIELIDAKIQETYKNHLKRLKVTGKIAFEEGKKVLYLTFVLGQKKLILEDDKGTNSGSSNLSYKQEPRFMTKVFTKRIELD